MGVVSLKPERLESALEGPDCSDSTDSSASEVDRSRELAEICRNHHAALLRSLSARTGSAEDAKEVLQEAYAKVLALDRPGPIKLLTGYIWQTALNLARKRRRRQALQTRFVQSTLSLSETRGLSAEREVESRERLVIVERAIGELPPRCLEAFVLHVLNDLTFAAVGREMRITERMAQKHVSRALEYLHSCLEAADARKTKR